MMNRRKVLLNMTLAVFAAMSVITACGQSQNNTTSGETGSPSPSAAGGASPGASPTQTLTMGTSPDYPPYEFKDTASGSSEVVGFDVDVAKYIANELGFQLEIKESDFNGLIPALQAGRVDFVMAGMTPTEERKKNVDFSEIYYEARNTIVAKKDTNYTKLEDLAGKEVGVQLGSTQETAVKDAAKNINGLKTVSRNRIPELIQEIKAGRIEAAVIEDTVAKGYVENNPDLIFNTIPSNPNQAGSAIAFPKGSERIEDFNKVIQKMKESGELERLSKKWFEQEIKK